jgi:hypothetical protein
MFFVRRGFLVLDRSTGRVFLFWFMNPGQSAFRGFSSFFCPLLGSCTHLDLPFFIFRELDRR